MYSSLTRVQLEEQCDPALPQLLKEFFVEWCVHHDAVLGIVASRFHTVYDKGEVDELMAQVLQKQLEIFNEPNAVAPAGPWRAYIITVIRNYVYSSLRKQRPEQRYRDQDLLKEAISVQAHLDPLLLDPELVLTLMEGRLGPEQMRVLRLYLVEGASNKAIAAQLGKGEGNVRCLKRAALTKVRQVLSQRDEPLKPRRDNTATTTKRNIRSFNVRGQRMSERNEGNERPGPAGV